ncbi:3955_t:CDS:1, partial [Acaulospora morrowiae]
MQTAGSSSFDPLSVGPSPADLRVHVLAKIASRYTQLMQDSVSIQTAGSSSFDPLSVGPPQQI